MPTSLSPLVQSFVLHFGEMGSRWGINRTVGQVYALLYISPQPLCADEIVRVRKKSVRHIAKRDADGKEKSGARPACGLPATIRP